MSLGNFDMSDFKPQRSKTAAELLTVAPHQEEKKTERIQLRIQSDVYLTFRDICEKQGTDFSKALRAYMIAAINNGHLLF